MSKESEVNIYRKIFLSRKSMKEINGWLPSYNQHGEISSMVFYCDGKIRARMANKGKYVKWECKNMVFIDPNKHYVPLFIRILDYLKKIFIKK